MNEMRGKGWGVLGYLLWMLGAGILLDAGAGPFGLILCGTGAVLFTVGVLQSRKGIPLGSTTPSDADVPMSTARSGLGGTR